MPYTEGNVGTWAESKHGSAEVDVLNGLVRSTREVLRLFSGGVLLLVVLVEDVLAF